MQTDKESWIVQTDSGSSQTTPFSHGATDNNAQSNGRGVGFATFIVDANRDTTNRSKFEGFDKAVNSGDSPLVHELFHGEEIMFGKASENFMQTASDSEERAVGLAKKRVLNSVSENEYYGQWHRMRASY